MTRSRVRGITLVEWMLTVVVMLIGGAALMVFLQSQTEFMEFSSVQGHLRSRSHLAVGSVVRELRLATRTATGSPPNAAIPAAPGNTSLTLYLPADLDSNGYIVDGAGEIEWDAANPVQYQYDAAARQLVRTAGGTSRVVASHVASVQFTDQTIDAGLADDQVRVQLTLEEATPRGRVVRATNSAVIQLRN
jgi:Tfp pilus assembly protein PilW